MLECYQEIIADVSAAIAQFFLSNETSLLKRSIFIDADVAEITSTVPLLKVRQGQRDSKRL